MNHPKTTEKHKIGELCTHMGLQSKSWNQEKTEAQRSEKSSVS